MAVTALYAGTATIGTTEYSLTLNSTTGVPASKTDAAVIQAWIDFANMTAADSYQIKLYEKIVSGGTQRGLILATPSGVQPPFIVPTLMMRNGWDITVKKLAGTDRSISWELRTA